MGARFDRKRLAGRPVPGFAGYALTEHALERVFEKLTCGGVDWDDIPLAVTRPQIVRDEGDRVRQQYGTVAVVVDHSTRTVITVFPVGNDYPVS